MKKIEDKELYEINGGGINWGIIAALGAFASFAVGFIDGYINPKKCNG